MQSPSSTDVICEQLTRLDRRIRWRRWLQGMRRVLLLAASLFLLWFLLDAGLGMRTAALRAALAGTASLVALGVIIDSWYAWRRRLDPIGLAHLLERGHPALAERLITLVQLDHEVQHGAMIAMIRAEAAEQLNHTSVVAACPMKKESRRWLAATVVIGATLGLLCAVSDLSAFSARFFRSWCTPLVPFDIDVNFGSGYALRGQSVAIEATVRMLDPRAAAPRECNLVCDYPGGLLVKIPMRASGDRFTATIDSLLQGVRCHVEADENPSEPFPIEVIAPPTFARPPTWTVLPPEYVNEKPKAHVLDEVHGSIDVLQFSKMSLTLQVDRRPVAAQMRVRNTSKMNGPPTEESVDVHWTGEVSCLATVLARQSGSFEVNLVMDLEHGLRANLPLGRFNVRVDGPPRFTRPLRLQGAATPLEPSEEYRIALEDRLRLETAIADGEGLGMIEIEYRVNDGAAQKLPWLHGAGRRELSVDDWLPLPKMRKVDDRLQFRVRAFDNRQIRQGTLSDQRGKALPAVDLMPQATSAPSDDRWITLHVDRSIKGFVKQQAQSQANDVAGTVRRLKELLQSESQQLQDLRRAIHKQTALQPAQARQAEKLQKLNQHIKNELENAGSRLLTNPALAPLALHFFDIGEVEMHRSGSALEQFLDKNRPLPDAEKELPSAQEAVASAVKKLEWMLEWNKMIEQDRLDQWQIQGLEQRQRELAQRLDELNNQKLTKEELAEQIEAIRNEQAKLAAETAQLQEKSRLVQDSLDALQQMRIKRLALEANKLAAERPAEDPIGMDSIPPDLKDRIALLAERQAQLAKRVLAYSQTEKGPDPKPAVDAAAALKEAKLEEAIRRQRLHEALLVQWMDATKKSNVASADKIRQFQAEQVKLRQETEKLLAELLKVAADASAPLKQKLDELGRELQGLAQKDKNGASQSMAKESAQMLDDAKKAMELSQALKAKGNAEEARKMDAEAERKLELALKQIARLAQDDAMKNQPMDGQEKTAEALQQSSAQMRKAEAELPTMPKDARAAMEMAAKQLAEAARQAAKQAARNLPSPQARNPAAKAPVPGAGRPDAILKELPRDEAVARAWGQLPGELKTRMMQDFRTRFGDDYAELIRQYFDRLAESPMPLRKD